MATHDSAIDDRGVVDAAREWAIHRRADGCVHIALDRVTLTLTTDEFNALPSLVGRALLRAQEQEQGADGAGVRLQSEGKGQVM